LSLVSAQVESAKGDVVEQIERAYAPVAKLGQVNGLFES
jgi:hypothetical protein